MIRISLVIATYNRGEKLLQTLGSVLGQSLDAQLWEAVVVNNNSTDRTEQLFKDFVSRNPGYNIKMVCETAQGLSHARNRGIAESQGELIAIIDDDELVNERFLEEYADLFEKFPDAAAAGGRIVAHYETDPPRWLSPIAERPIAGILDLGPEIKPFPAGKYPGGGNMCARRTVFGKYGAFNPELGRTGTNLMAGEEKDFFNRLTAAGEIIYYVPGAVIQHMIPGVRLNRQYFSRLARMIGLSERVRTLSVSRPAFNRRCFSEAFKWCATGILWFWYVVTLRPAKGNYLFIFRWNVTLGLLGKSVRPEK